MNIDDARMMTDNRPENLQVFISHSEHMKLHMHSAEAARRGKGGNQARRRAALAATRPAAESDASPPAEQEQR